MKKLNSLLLVLFAVAFVACKDDETTPTFLQADFIGEWEVTNYVGLDPDSDGPCAYTITEDDFSETSGCGSGFEISIEGSYTFNGKNKITLDDEFFGELSWVILELNSTTIKMEQRLDGDKYGTVTATKVVR